MKANVITAHGPACAVFGIQEMPDPVASPTDLILQVRTTSVNPLDCRIRNQAAIPRNFPLILGFDVCGIVVDKGSDVEGFSIGDRVIGSPTPFRNGANATYVAIDYRSCALAGGLDDETGAALPLVGITAYEALFERLLVGQDDLIVIHAGAGGVGHLAVQLAKQAGCRVITTASRQESLTYCRQVLGADYVINYQQEDVSAAVLELSKGQGVAFVLDCVGGATFSQSIDFTAFNGRICSILPVAINEREGYRLLLKNITLSYQFMGGPLQRPAGNQQGAVLKRLVAMVEAGYLQPRVANVYPLEKLALAHEHLETGHTIGKRIIRVG